jgi:hypothetical protein
LKLSTTGPSPTHRVGADDADSDEDDDEDEDGVCVGDPVDGAMLEAEVGSAADGDDASPQAARSRTGTTVAAARRAAPGGFMCLGRRVVG